MLLTAPGGRDGALAIASCLVQIADCVRLQRVTGGAADSSWSATSVLRPAATEIAATAISAHVVRFDGWTGIVGLRSYQRPS